LANKEVVTALPPNINPKPSSAGARNIISGNNNLNGVQITNEASTNQVQGNFIRTDASGTAAPQCLDALLSVRN